MSHSVSNNLNSCRFELPLEGYTAFIQYRLSGGEITLVHTEVPPPLEGRGLASALARHAFEFAKQGGLKVVPVCPYIRKYLEKHPEYQPLVKS